MNRTVAFPNIVITINVTSKVMVYSSSQYTKIFTQQFKILKIQKFIIFYKLTQIRISKEKSIKLKTKKESKFQYSLTQH